MLAVWSAARGTGSFESGYRLRQFVFSRSLAIDGRRQNVDANQSVIESLRWRDAARYFGHYAAQREDAHVSVRGVLRHTSRAALAQRRCDNSHSSVYGTVESESR